MKLFKTYKEAVISNGSVRGIYKNAMSGEFCHLVPGGCFRIDEPPLLGNTPWFKCNPEDCLESVADFQRRGKLLNLGDDVISVTGRVIRLDQCCEVWNSPSDGHDKRFVLQAAADSEDTDTTWKPVVGDEVSTCEGIGKVLTTVVRDNLTGYIVQFENDWNEFNLSELRDETEPDYKAGRALRELFISCHSDSATQLGFDALTKPARNAWIEFAKLVKRA